MAVMGLSNVPYPLNWQTVVWITQRIDSAEIPFPHGMYLSKSGQSVYRRRPRTAGIALTNDFAIAGVLVGHGVLWGVLTFPQRGVYRKQFG